MNIIKKDIIITFSFFVLLFRLFLSLILELTGTPYSFVFVLSSIFCILSSDDGLGFGGPSDVSSSLFYWKFMKLICRKQEIYHFLMHFFFENTMA